MNKYVKNIVFTTLAFSTIATLVIRSKYKKIIKELDYEEYEDDSEDLTTEDYSDEKQLQKNYYIDLNFNKKNS